MVSSLDVVVGGSFGSESKGRTTAELVRLRCQQQDALGRSGLVASVRVGGPNAGHVVIDKKGNRFALQQIPVGAIYPEARLVIAAGSEVDPEVLHREVDQLEAAGHDIRNRLYIDGSATLLEPRHKITEGENRETDGKDESTGLAKRIGSTAKGIGAARADRIMRTANTVGSPFASVAMDDLSMCVMGGTDQFLRRILKTDGSVIIEGTQGYGLGLHTQFYPFCTSNDARAIDFLSQAGISPWEFGSWGTADAALKGGVWVVFRPNPIRVAGNSGPLYQETTWEALGIDPEQERTTVTRRVRRVGEWDWQLAEQAIAANGGSDARIVLAMADYKIPGLANVEKIRDLDEVSTKKLYNWVTELETRLDANVWQVGTGPSTSMWLKKVDLA